MFPLLDDEFFVRQSPRAGHVSCATLDPGKSRFSLVIAVVARAVAQRRLDHETLWKHFLQGVTQIAKIHALSQPVQTKGRRQAVRAVVPEYERLHKFVFQPPGGQSTLVESQREQSLSHGQSPRGSRELRQQRDRVRQPKFEIAVDWPAPPRA